MSNFAHVFLFKDDYSRTKSLLRVKESGNCFLCSERNAKRMLGKNTPKITTWKLFFWQFVFPGAYLYANAHELMKPNEEEVWLDGILYCCVFWFCAF